MNFKNKTTEQILKSYEFPHRFLVYYASQCAKGAVQAHVKDPDPGTLKAIDITERFGLGEEIGQEELIKTTGDAYAAAHAAANVAASAVYAANAAADAACASNAARAAAYAADAARAAEAASDAAYTSNAAAYAARAADAAAYAASYAADAAAYTAYAAGYASNAAAYAAYAAAHAAHSADAVRPKAEAKYKKLLITLINQRFSEVEKIMMFGIKYELQK